MNTPRRKLAYIKSYGCFYSRNLTYSWAIIFQPLKNHSLSIECSYKPSGKWEYGFHTSCEAYVYYFPYNKTIPTKCVSQPDETKVKTAIKEIFGLTVPEVGKFPKFLLRRDNDASRSRELAGEKIMKCDFTHAKFEFHGHFLPFDLIGIIFKIL